MGENFKQYFSKNSVCEMIMLDYDIYTTICTKQLHSQYPILHQSLRLYIIDQMKLV
jgi:hypothetical protein